MINIVGVRFKNAGKIYYFDPVDFEIEEDMDVVVETARGLEYGTIVVGKKEIDEESLVSPLKPIIRIATEEDTKIYKENKEKANKRQRYIFNKYGLDKKVDNFYPFELSGGMARKVLLSTALVSDCKVIIADEPTPGLDEKSLNEALKDFRNIADSGCAILMITHDIEAALKIADKIAVFYAGTTLEIANVNDFKGDGKNLRHPYSKALFNALPQNGFKPIKGSQPMPNELPKGCLFQDRCEYIGEKCRLIRPNARMVRDGMVRCLNAT